MQSSDIIKSSQPKSDAAMLSRRHMAEVICVLNVRVFCVHVCFLLLHRRDVARLGSAVE